MKEVKLTHLQIDILKRLNSGERMTLTMPKGVGKTFLSKKIREHKQLLKLYGYNIPGRNNNF